MSLTKRRLRLYLASAAFLFVVWATYKTLFVGSKCKMGDNLNPIITNILETFEKHGIQVYLDDGTLLGMYRDGKVMDFEFDADLSIQQADLDKVVALRKHFQDSYDYSLYTLGDYIFQKGWTMLYMLKWEPYLVDAPCVRIYDPDKWYYADVYCDVRVTKAEMLNLTTFPPAGYDDPKNAGKMFLCDMEMGTRENCMFEDMIFPLKTIKGLGRDLPVPHDIEGVLTQVYGPDWRIPRPKGIKTIICNRTGWWASFLVVLVILFILSIPIRAEFRERERPRLPLSARDHLK
eukprot:m.101302 g.101302  ORF g.101302 m.101302 type:complete len:290 (+) comp14088_c1_seq1:148-1017(+)